MIKWVSSDELPVDTEATYVVRYSNSGMYYQIGLGVYFDHPNSARGFYHFEDSIEEYVRYPNVVGWIKLPSGNEMDISTSKLYMEKCHPSAKLPTYANYGDAGMDLYSTEEFFIKPGETVPVPTGLKMAIPYGYEVQIRPRSGISFNTPLRVPNAPGTIDCGYRDEVKVLIHNSSIVCGDHVKTFELDAKGNQSGIYHIKPGDRIAQMVFTRVSYADIELVDSVQKIGTNRGGGFGHTGV